MARWPWSHVSDSLCAIVIRVVQVQRHLQMAP